MKPSLPICLLLKHFVKKLTGNSKVFLRLHQGQAAIVVLVDIADK